MGKSKLARISDEMYDLISQRKEVLNEIRKDMDRGSDVSFVKASQQLACEYKKKRFGIKRDDWIF